MKDEGILADTVGTFSVCAIGFSGGAEPLSTSAGSARRSPFADSGASEPSYGSARAHHAAVPKHSSRDGWRWS